MRTTPGSGCRPMPDWLALWQVFCLVLMVAIVVTVAIAEKGDR